MEVSFTSLNNPGACFKYDRLEVPRIGDHVVIFDTPRGEKIVLEGKVVKVRWVIVDGEGDAAVTVVVDGVPV